MAGSAQAVVDQLVEVVAAGFTFLLLGPTTLRDQAVLGEEVIPGVRAEVAERGILTTSV